MWSPTILVLATLLSASSATTYGFDDIPADQAAWNRLVSFLMDTTSQQAEPEYGKCGDLCYIIDGEKKLVLKEGKEYKNPDRPCDVYRCTVSSTDVLRVSVIISLLIIQSTQMELIDMSGQCQSVDDLEPSCPDGGRVVRLPEQCCAECEKPTPPVDQFTEWKEWTPCSKTCGRGAQARMRECVIAEDGQVVDCRGETVEVRDCNAKPCTVKCVWHEWSAWDSCSVMCGYGIETRTRKPINAYYEGLNCQGSREETRSCTRPPCTGAAYCPDTETRCNGGCIPDVDHDCIRDGTDNCIYEFNPDQVDHDVDNKGDECDNCEYDKNEDQKNNDGDKQGDVCDSDDDNDNVFDDFDNCKFIANSDQSDIRQKYGSACDTTGNGIVIGMTAEEKEGLVAEIMKLMMEMYYSE
jgi:hypothetical protein